MTDFDIFEDQQQTLDQIKDYTRKEIGQSESCQQLENYGEYGLGEDMCIGCPRFRNLIPMHTPAGWYLGTKDRDGGPWCRATGYMSQEQALVLRDGIARFLSIARIEKSASL